MKLSYLDSDLGPFLSLSIILYIFRMLRLGSLKVGEMGRLSVLLSPPLRAGDGARGCTQRGQQAAPSPACEPLPQIPAVQAELSRAIGAACTGRVSAPRTRRREANVPPPRGAPRCPQPAHAPHTRLRSATPTCASAAAP